MATATISIDWEDFGQMYGKYHYGSFTEPTRGAIERQTDIMLNLLGTTQQKATFFILGKLATYKPALVKKIAAAGHEIALHGQNHDPMFTLTPQQAREDVATAQKIVTDITGEPVYGYRAPYFSIVKENIYLLDILAELGLLYDSSIFPMALPRYGIADFNKNDQLYTLPNGMQLVELPMTTGTYFNREWPVAGGGYVRLMPAFLINKIFKSFDQKNRDTMIYMHPYEFDTQAIDVTSNYPEGASYSTIKTAALNFKWNLFRPSINSKLKTLLQTYTFTTCLQKAHAISQSQQAVPLVLNA